MELAAEAHQLLNDLNLAFYQGAVRLKALKCAALRG